MDQYMTFGEAHTLLLIKHDQAIEEVRRLVRDPGLLNPDWNCLIEARAKERSAANDVIDFNNLVRAVEKSVEKPSA